MKTYFVRAIPREGKIESGDYVFFKINGKWIGPADFDSMLGPQIEDVKRAVFYLCSRDIKVGDIATEMLDNGDFEDFEIHTENDIYPEFIKDGFQFKIVEQLSPDATWVNEDTEFDEDQWRRRWWHNDGKFFTAHTWDPSDEHTDLGEARREGRMQVFAQIKCPTCKKFH